MKKKFLVIVMTIAMIVGLVPMFGVYATDNTVNVQLSGLNNDKTTATYSVMSSQVVVSISDPTKVNDSGILVSTISDHAKVSGKYVKLINGLTISSFDSSKYQLTVDEVTLDPNDSGRVVKDCIVNDDKIYIDVSNGGIPNDFKFTLNFSLKPGKFENSVYVVWKGSEIAGGKHKLCKKLLTGLTPGIGINYVDGTTVADGSDQFNVQEMAKNPDADYHFVWADRIEEVNIACENWEALQEKFYDEDETFKRAVIVNPVNANNGANSVSTDGDHQFRAVIYGTGYQAIKFDDTVSNYVYFPDFWDQTFFNSTIDISGTSIEKPAEFAASIYNDEVKFSVSDFDNRGRTISSISVASGNTNECDIVGPEEGKYTIKFKSKFYDSVVLKIVIGGQDYFIRISRDVFLVNADPGKYTASFYYPSNLEYKDYDVIAKINYFDGTYELKTLSAIEIEDPFNPGEKTGKYSMDGGKNLKFSQYQVIEGSKKISTICYNVTKKGATKINNSTYGGSFVGSGNGITFDTQRGERGEIVR